MSIRSVVRAVASVAAVTALAGCGDHQGPVAPVSQVNAPTNPSSPAATSPATASPLPSFDYSAPAPNPGGQYPVLHRLAPITTTVSASASIGQRGGLLALPVTGLYVYFPEGAVQQRTTFTVTANMGPFVSYTFQPHTLFQQPVILIQDLSYTEAKGNPALIANVQGGYLAHGSADISTTGTGNFAETYTAFIVNASELPSQSTYAVFFTTHFSGYAYASGRSSIDATN